MSKLVVGVSSWKLNLKRARVLGRGSAIRRGPGTGQAARGCVLDLQGGAVEVAVESRRAQPDSLSPEELHAQQSEDHDEEEEQEQQADDGLHGVQQGHHQVAQGAPVPAGGRPVGARPGARTTLTRGLGSFPT